MTIIASDEHLEQILAARAQRGMVNVPRERNRDKADMQKRKAERMRGVLYRAGINTREDFDTIVTDAMLVQAAKIIGSGAPSERTVALLRGMFD